MLSARINPDKCLVSTPYVSDAFKKVKVISDSSSIKKQLLKHCKDAAQKKSVDDHLSTHIGPGSGFKHKGILKKYLSYILATLDGRVKGVNLSKDRVEAIIEKLTEEISQCSEGYLNRAYIVMGSFHQPHTLDELLSAYRLHVIEKAYLLAGTSEVHANHRFYVVANTMGYAIPYEEVEDKYVGAIKDSDIQAYLMSAFNEWYTPEKIVTHIWEHANMELLGYVGKKKDALGYSIGDYQNIEKYLSELLDREISLSDCFLIDEETDAIMDINWSRIKSFLIEKLERAGYFSWPKEAITKEIRNKGETLVYTYVKGEYDKGVLEYRSKEGDVYFQYGLTSEKVAFHQFSTAMKLAFESWVFGKFVKSEKPPLDFVLKLYELGALGEISIATYLNDGVINSIDSLVSVVNHLKNGKLEALLQTKECLERLVKSNSDLLKLLKALDIEKRKLIIEKLLPNIDGYVKTAEQFSSVYKLIGDVNQKAEFLRSQKNRYIGFVNNETSLAKVIDCLATKDCYELFELLPPKLVRSINTKNKIQYLFENTASEKYDAISYCLENSILNAIKTAQDVVDLMGGQLGDSESESESESETKTNPGAEDDVDTAECRRYAIYTTVCEDLHRFVKSVKDFKMIYGAVNEQVADGYFSLILQEGVFSRIIKTGRDFASIYTLLSQDQKDELFDEMMSHPGILVKLLASSDHFNSVIDCLSDDHRKAFVTKASVVWPHIMSDLQVFSKIAKNLNKDERYLLCETVKQGLLPLVKSVNDIAIVIDVIPRMDGYGFLEELALSEMVSECIKHKRDVVALFESVSPENYDMISACLETQILAVIESAADIVDLMGGQSGDSESESEFETKTNPGAEDDVDAAECRRYAIYTTVCEDLHRFVRSVDDFKVIYGTVNEQVADGFFAMMIQEGVIPKILTSIGGLVTLSGLLSQSQNDELKNLIKERFPALLTSASSEQKKHLSKLGYIDLAIKKNVSISQQGLFARDSSKTKAVHHRRRVRRDLSGGSVTHHRRPVLVGVN